MQGAAGDYATQQGPVASSFPRAQEAARSVPAGRARAVQSFSQGLSLQAEEVLLPVPLLQENRPPVTRRGDTAVPAPLGTCHQGDDAVGMSPPLQEAKAERLSKRCAWMHLGGSVFQGKGPGPGSLGLHPRTPQEGGTYHLEVPVELGVLPHVAQEAGRRSG